MADTINIFEVGPRDGLQNEARNVPVSTRIELIRRLSAAGIRQIEVGAFVSPLWVPQMRNTHEVVRKILRAKKARVSLRKTRYSVLVPNPHGMEEALKSSIKEVAVFGACSEAFSRRNINCSIGESFIRFREVMKLARLNKMRVRGYLSMSFGCPYEGKIPQARVVRLVEEMLDIGVAEVSLGDTIGVATPKQVRELLKKISRVTSLRRVALHFHDTRGTALANVLASLDFDVRTFDSSIGGLGGCPYAKGAAGNLATEDLAYMLEGMGFKTGVQLQQLIEIKRWMEKIIKRPLPSHVGRAGLPLRGTIF